MKVFIFLLITSIPFAFSQKVQFEGRIKGKVVSFDKKTVKFKLSDVGETIKLDRKVLESYRPKNGHVNKWKGQTKEIEIAYPFNLPSHRYIPVTKSYLNNLHEHGMLKDLVSAYRNFMVNIDQHNLDPRSVIQKQTFINIIKKFPSLLFPKAYGDKPGDPCIFGGWISKINANGKTCGHPGSEENRSSTNYKFDKKCGLDGFICNPTLFGDKLKRETESYQLPDGVIVTEYGVCLPANVHRRYRDATKKCFEVTNGDGYSTKIANSIKDNPQRFQELTNEVEEFCKTHELGISGNTNTYNACVYLRDRVGEIRADLAAITPSECKVLETNGPRYETEELDEEEVETKTVNISYQTYIMKGENVQKGKMENVSVNVANVPRLCSLNLKNKLIENKEKKQSFKFCEGSCTASGSYTDKQTEEKIVGYRPKDQDSFKFEPECSIPKGQIKKKKKFEFIYKFKDESNKEIAGSYSKRVSVPKGCGESESVNIDFSDEDFIQNQKITFCGQNCSINFDGLVEPVTETIHEAPEFEKDELVVKCTGTEAEKDNKPECLRALVECKNEKSNSTITGYLNPASENLSNYWTLVKNDLIDYQDYLFENIERHKESDSCVAKNRVYISKTCLSFSNDEGNDYSRDKDADNNCVAVGKCYGEVDIDSNSDADPLLMTAELNCRKSCNVLKSDFGRLKARHYKVYETRDYGRRISSTEESFYQYLKSHCNGHASGNKHEVEFLKDIRTGISHGISKEK